MDPECALHSELLLVWTNGYTIDHFTVVSLVAWPLNESETGVDLVLIETSLLFICKFLLLENSIINMRKAGRFLSKQGHLQPHFHSKARQLSKKL